VKEIAEHIMLVDLCRNDIGRVCEPGTLDVDELLVIEKYSTVFHLVSNVLGRLTPRRDVYDVIAATFPAGTMTGAPKIRATEIIEDLETTRRGIYAGAIGVIDFSGYANLALCIRTAVHSEGQYVIRASAGTVADSDPEYEWRETIAKLNATYWAIAGEEYVG
jgi:anthranilate synthase component 1